MERQAIIAEGMEVVNYVIDNHNSTIAFNMNQSTLDSIIFNIHVKSYSTILYMYGYKFLLAISEYYEKNEKYEFCAEIVNAIKKHNEMTNYIDPIPTRY